MKHTYQTDSNVNTQTRHSTTATTNNKIIQIIIKVDSSINTIPTRRVELVYLIYINGYKIIQVLESFSTCELTISSTEACLLTSLAVMSFSSIWSFRDDTDDRKFPSSMTLFEMTRAWRAPGKTPGREYISSSSSSVAEVGLLAIVQQGFSMIVLVMR